VKEDEVTRGGGRRGAEGGVGRGTAEGGVRVSRR